MTGGDGGRTAAAVAARRHNTQAALARVRDVLARMRREKTPDSPRIRAPAGRRLMRLGSNRIPTDFGSGQAMVGCFHRTPQCSGNRMIREKPLTRSGSALMKYL